MFRCSGCLVNLEIKADGLDLGEKFSAKFDDKFYPIEHDLAHTMVAAKY